ncbi:uncharacterized protein V1518DRAFT_429187 [Limtongia smithiae]|uniref:uncharacterized protein n=1 Tax=Limtongia smithiae TaxID=1125753 RepID=UPI0034CE9704
MSSAAMGVSGAAVSRQVVFEHSPTEAKAPADGVFATYFHEFDCFTVHSDSDTNWPQLRARMLLIGDGSENGGEDKIAEELMSQGKFESAYGYLSWKLEQVIRNDSSGAEDILNRRMHAALAAGEIEWGLRDAAEGVCSHRPIWTPMDDEEPVSRLAPEALTDPILRLPREIFAEILEQLPYHTRYVLRNLNSAWREAVRETWSMCNVVDFTGCRYAVTYDVFMDAIYSCQGGYHGSCGLDEICIGNVSAADVNRISMEVLGYTKIMRPLRVLRLHHSAPAWYYIARTFLSPARTPYTRFANLQVLQVRMIDSAVVTELFANGMFPELRTLEFSAPYDICDYEHIRTFLTMHTSYAATQCTAQLEVLKLGGSLPYSDHFPYKQRSARTRIGEKSLKRLLSLVPKLRELYCVLVDIVDGALEDAEVVHAAHEISTDMNLREVLPQLKVLDMSWSNSYHPVGVPASCEVLNFNFSNQWLRPIVSAVQDYRSLKVLGWARFGCTQSDSAILDALVDCCDPKVLEGINLHGQKVIDYTRDMLRAGSRPPRESVMAPLTPRARVFERAEAYGIKLDERPQPFLKVLAQVYPGLRKLALGFNESLTDDALLDLRDMRMLDYLDIASTSVTARGLVELLVHGAVDADGFISAVERGETVSGVLVGSALKTIVAHCIGGITARFADGMHAQFGVSICCGGAGKGGGTWSQETMRTFGDYARR